MKVRASLPVHSLPPSRRATHRRRSHSHRRNICFAIAYNFEYRSVICRAVAASQQSILVVNEVMRCAALF